MKSALRWTMIWIGLAFLFAALIYVLKGPSLSLEFITCYLVEESLSIDNMFVFVLIFQFFKMAGPEQARVLKWGILGAIAMRFVLIFTGVSLVARFSWIFYVLGVLLIVTAIKLMLEKEGVSANPEDNKMLKLARKIMPLTPFMAALIVIESSDILFAMDSIPAVLAISKDPFIVFSSNIFAILGLRALYFLVSGFLSLFRFLRYGLSLVLIFIGAKMLLTDFYPIPVSASLAVVAGVLALTMGASVVWKEQKA